MTVQYRSISDMNIGDLFFWWVMVSEKLALVIATKNIALNKSGSFDPVADTSILGTQTV